MIQKKYIFLFYRWELTGIETVLLSLLVHSLPPCSSRDVPVYLPYGSPRVCLTIWSFTQLLWPSTLKVATVCCVLYCSSVGKTLNCCNSTGKRYFPHLLLLLYMLITAFWLPHYQTYCMTYHSKKYKITKNTSGICKWTFDGFYQVIKMALGALSS